MKKNLGFAAQFILIILFGLAVTLFSGEYEWSYTVNPLAGAELEDVLRYLNMGLPLLALALGAGVGIYGLLKREDE